MEAHGNDGTLRVLAEGVVLEFKKMTRASKKVAEQVIPYSSIIGIELAKGRRLSPSYVRFLTDDVETPPPPQKDPMAMCFIGDKQGAALGQLAASVSAATGIPVSGDLAHLAVLPTAGDELTASGLRPDVASAVEKMGWKLGGRREIKHLNEYLTPHETVHRIVQGTYENDQGIAVLTDQRLVFLFHGLVRNRVEEFYFDRISSVQNEGGIATGSVVIHASGNKAKISQIVKDDARALADDIRTHLGGPRVVAAVEPPVADPVGADPLEQIRKLGELRDAGLLSDDEFEAKKGDLLRRL